MASTTVDGDTRERLLRTVKREVKQIMEEAVTRKFVHEESSSITQLCGAVEACLLNGLKKRALGLFKNSTTTALLQKVSKNCAAANQVSALLSDVESSNETARKSVDGNKNQTMKLKATYNPKYLWIRIALFEKQLAKIIDYLVQNSSKYYEKEALVADPCDGPLLASLLVGPCALDYTKMKTSDHYWTDPPADELVQRHRIHSSGNHHIGRPDSPKRPGLQAIRRNTSSSSDESMRVAPLSAKEYVESLHQNLKSTLLYGKNNVRVQPKEDVTPLPGYLSLHQGSEGLSLKWTPNQLMNGCCEETDTEIDRRPIYAKYAKGQRRNGHKRLLYWDYAVTVFFDEIVYLHCHQQPDSGGTIVLVGQDGVQRPPIHFPKGGHLLAFLSCLETGLLPHGQLDPPLWSQRGKGKVFPKLRRKGSRLTNGHGSKFEELEATNGSQISLSLDMDSISELAEDEATDYVFRIISAFKPDNLPEAILDPKAKPERLNSLANFFPWPLNREPSNKGILKQQSSGSFVSDSDTSSTSGEPLSREDSVQEYAKAQRQMNTRCISKIEHRTVVQQLCDTMKNQIISRAFYGWLAHCRHLKTVRTHLSGLVNNDIVPIDLPSDASSGLTKKIWESFIHDGMVCEEEEVYRLIYYGGCDHEIRKDVWPCLLGHYKFGSTAKEREELDEATKQQYEKTMSEWLAVEAIVRQRDKEITAANMAKLSGNSQDGGGHIPLVGNETVNVSNDNVFESVESEDYHTSDTVIEESSCATTPTTAPSTPRAKQDPEREAVLNKTNAPDRPSKTSSTSPDEGLGESLGRQTSLTDSKRSDSCDTDRNVEGLKLSESDENNTENSNIIVTNPSIDWRNQLKRAEEIDEDNIDPDKIRIEQGIRLSTSKESILSASSPVSNASNGGIYSAEMLDNVGLNLHRIDKDVQRCDRNYPFFTPTNLDKLRNVMCTYVWEHLDVGYVQGMCDLVAPLLVIFDDEAKTYSCFCHLMTRMSQNFPHGGAMDNHFANMRSLIQILDSEIFEHMHQNGDYTHFYFSYRWFLLDFKRELVYDDVFSVWETIWSAKHISSANFVLFIALALVEYYREIILDNNMDFTDIIKFFNEMAEHHKAGQILNLARDLVFRLQDLIENK